MKLSFIIITWNGRELLSECLASIATYVERPDAEILVVDNGSTDGTVEFIRHEYPSVRLFELHSNHGVAVARNIALREARGEYLFIIDNDLHLNDAAVEGLVRYLDEHSDAGLCACQLLDGGGHVQPSAKRYPGIMMKLRNLFRPDEYNYSYPLPSLTEPFEPEYVIGACQMIRRSAFETVGLLDEKIFYGAEDADYCLRMHAAGWRVVYLPQYQMTHYCQRVTNGRMLSYLGRKHITGLLYFYWKNKRFLV